MADCTEIRPRLGAFEDGELQPSETHEVTRHLAQCTSCEAELADIAGLGGRLRAIAVEPDLTGFTQAVQKRITALTTPLHVRVRRYIESVREQISAGFALTAAGLATAALTALLLTPHASQIASRLGLQSGPVPTSAPMTLASASPSAPTVETVENEVSPELVASRDSRAVISSLESHVPSVAVWSEPEAKTAVIWVPDQQ
jgi:anti-sigma factor RsiW